MKNELQIQLCNIKKYCSNQKKKYTMWVYLQNDNLRVFQKETPNTDQIWFQFYSFSYLYWKLMQNKCIDYINGQPYYNFNRIKIFMIEYLLCGTNLQNIYIKRDINGVLTQDSMNSVMKTHPKILRSLFNLIDIFPEKISGQQEKDLEKQCSILFGKGDSVTNPHKWIIIYCNLMSFWQKFGLNYFDIMKLPNQTFLMLKKIMNLQASYKNTQMTNSIPSNKNKGVKF